MNLQAGTYQYKFIVDGKWTYDHTQNCASDGFGSYNNILELVPRLVVYDDTEESEEDERILSQISGGHNESTPNLLDNWDYQRVIKISTTLDAPDIRVKGQWDNWTGETKMSRLFNNYKNNYENVVRLKIRPGRYEYKFICNGIFMHDPNQKCVKNEFGTYNNLIYVETAQSTNGLNSLSLNSRASYVPLELDCTKLAWKSLSFHHVSWEKMRG